MEANKVSTSNDLKSTQNERKKEVLRVVTQRKAHRLVIQYQMIRPEIILKTLEIMFRKIDGYVYIHAIIINIL